MSARTSSLRRAIEAGDLMVFRTVGLRDRAALLSCYAALLRTTTSKAEVRLRLRIGGRVFRVRMRRSDLFTLAEIVHQSVYRLASLLPERPVIVDAGANVGLSGLWFLGHYPGARLHCFEPASDNFALLAENLAELDGVTLVRAALGARAGSVELHLAEHGAMHSVLSGAPGSRREIVPMQTLADYLAEHRIERVDLLKLDVEGSELDVLRGLGERLASVDVIAGEMHETLVDANEVYELLARNGFRVLSRRPIAGEEGVHMWEAAR